MDDFTPQIPLPLAVFERAMHTPERIFLQEVSGRVDTFGGFLDGVAQWVAILEALEVEAGDRVGVMMPTGIDAHRVWLACAWLKAWEVPVNTAFRGRMLEHLMNDPQVSVLVVSRQFFDAVAAVAEQVPSLRAIVVPDAETITHSLSLPVVTGNELPKAGTVREPPVLSPADVATVLYTSGTTGPSKGCIIPWGEFYWGIDIFRPDKDGSDCQYCPFPINHFSGKCPVYNMAVLGGRVVLRERFSTSAFWSDIREYDCTTTILLGGTATFLAKQPPRPDDADNPMRTVLMAPGIAEFRDFEQRFGVRIVAAYGMTEIAWPFLSEPGSLPHYATCGKLRPQWHVRVVDAEGHDVATGEVGELLVRCDVPHSMMQVYLGRPEATEAAWEGGWFHTGDAFRYDEEGNYYFVDRFKDALRRRGENISSFEVESYINDYDAVAVSAVIGVPSETGEDEVMAFFIPKEGRVIDPDALAAYLRPRMPDFMLPRYFECVEELPMTATAKVKKAELRLRGRGPATWDRLTAGNCKSTCEQSATE